MDRDADCTRLTAPIAADCTGPTALNCTFITHTPFLSQVLKSACESGTRPVARSLGMINMSFFFLNRFLDIADAIEDPENAAIDNTDSSTCWGVVGPLGGAVGLWASRACSLSEKLREALSELDSAAWAPALNRLQDFMDTDIPSPYDLDLPETLFIKGQQASQGGGKEQSALRGTMSTASEVSTTTKSLTPMTATMRDSARI